MKKAIYLLSVFTAFTITANAQKTIKGNGELGSETRKTATYDEIKLIGSTNVEIIDGTEGEITITGDSNLLSYVETTVTNNELTVKLKSNHNYSMKKSLRVSVPVQNISKISLVGSGDITSKKVLTDKNLTVNLNGSGDITLQVDNENVVAELFGSGDLVLKGKSKKLKASVKGSGDLIAKGLKTETAELNVNGSGDIEAHVTREVNAAVVGSGDIKVTGSPHQIIKNVKGSGSIEIK